MNMEVRRRDILKVSGLGGAAALVPGCLSTLRRRAAEACGRKPSC